MGVLVLSGPPAAGKNTIAQVIAERLQRCAVVDVDVVRWMALRPHAAPWEGDEGRAQQHLGVRNACALASNFRDAGFDVVVLDVLSADTMALYRGLLAGPGLVFARLLPSREEIIRRNRDRGPRLRDAEVRMMYDGQAALLGWDVSLDNSALAPGEVAGRLCALFTTAGGNC